jgi:hypothetical protein
MHRRRAAWIALALLAAPAFAQDAPPDLATLSERAAKRFPQPVRSGDLAGRDVLEPIEAQPVLGHVSGAARRKDGGADLLIRLDGVLGLAGRTVAVPAEAAALLGEHVAMLDYTRAQLRALPDADPSAARLPPDETIRMGLARPFH